MGQAEIILSPNQARVFGLLRSEHQLSPTQIGGELFISIKKVCEALTSLEKRGMVEKINENLTALEESIPWGLPISLRRF